MSMFSERSGRFRAAIRNRNAIFPNIITILGLLSGVYSIMLSVGTRENNFVFAAYFLVLASIFDGLDGKVARLVNGTSDFGIQLDSLCDLVSFGVAPAILVYEWALKDFGRVGIAAVFVFVACGALRLARFNVQAGKISNVYFVGLPIPAASAFIAASVLFINKMDLDLDKLSLSIFFLLSVYFLAFLMVSSIPFFSFKKVAYFKERPFQSLVLIVLVMSLLVIYFDIFFFVFTFSYITVGLVTAALKSMRRGKYAESRQDS